METVKQRVGFFSWPKWIGIIVVLLSFFVFSYNSLQTLDEKVSAKWSDVVNQYQRRADLVPNLVETVKGYAAHEEQVLTAVTEARAKVSNINLTAESINDPEALAKFQQAQSQLTGALSRLIAVSESYPDLKANTTFENLMAQLEGSENRISTARTRYIDAVKAYNVKVRKFPSNMIARLFGMQEKANFSVDNEEEISKAPEVNFN